MLATMPSNVSPRRSASEPARSSTTAAASFAEDGGGDGHGLGVVVDGQHAGGAAPCRDDREQAGAGAQIEPSRTGGDVPLQAGRAEARRLVLSGSERHSGNQPDRIAPAGRFCALVLHHDKALTERDRRQRLLPALDPATIRHRLDRQPPRGIDQAVRRENEPRTLTPRFGILAGGEVDANPARSGTRGGDFDPQASVS
jgi:hypothetical protein